MSTPDSTVIVTYESYQGSRRVIVTGMDYDAVNDAVLDQKNNVAPEQTPQVIGPQFDAATGGWRAVVWTRKAVQA